jgi:ABC-type enterobactin transport system permease subunit
MFIAQRATMINVNIRHNCSNLFIFRSCMDDCRLLANDFALSDLTPAASLPVGSCLASIGGEEPQLMRVF